MALTKEQEIYVQNYVHSMVDYRETYEELSDHLITALQDGDLRSDEQLRDAISGIIVEDFGGPYELLMSEKQRCEQLVPKLRKVQHKSFVRVLTKPWIWLLLGALFWVNYQLEGFLDNRLVLKTCLIMMYLPALGFGVYKLCTWRLKKSIKEKSVWNEVYLLFLLPQTVFLIAKSYTDIQTEDISAYACLAIVVISLAYCFQVCRMMNREIQVLQRLVAA